MYRASQKSILTEFWGQRGGTRFWAKVVQNGPNRPKRSKTTFFLYLLLPLRAHKSTVWRGIISNKGSPPLKKSAVFFNIVQKPFDAPPPFIWTFVLFCRGCFLSCGDYLNDAPPYTMARMSSPHLKCCINVGVREAPCKKSFGILASYWTPPKIK